MVSGLERYSFALVMLKVEGSNPANAILFLRESNYWTRTAQLICATLAFGGRSAKFESRPNVLNSSLLFISHSLSQWMSDLLFVKDGSITAEGYLVCKQWTQTRRMTSST